MTKQGVLASVVVCLMPVSYFMGMQTAAAKQCSVAMPSKPKGHWSYRFIDGRKCWYEGQNNLPKSLLKWSEKTSPPDKASPRLEKEALAPVKEAMTTVTERPSDAPQQNACCGTMIEGPFTFEARWRGLLSHDQR